MRPLPKNVRLHEDDSYLTLPAEKGFPLPSSSGLFARKNVGGISLFLFLRMMTVKV